MASFLYDTGNSVLQSAQAAAISALFKNPDLGATLLANSAAQSRMRDLYDQGASNFQVITGGVASGLAEWLGERLSIENLITPKEIYTKKDVLTNVLQQMGVEASEEAATEILNAAYDIAARKDQSDIGQSIKKYRQDGEKNAVQGVCR